MPFRPANLVHTDEADPVESTPSEVGDGSPEPGTRSSAGEHPLHTGRVAGSIPAASTTPVPWEMDDALYKTRPKTKSASGYTYVISASGFGLKIGHSRRPAGRLAEMQVGSPVSMWVCHTWRLSPAGAKHLEAQLHTVFGFAAIRGEWFDVKPLEVIATGDLFVTGRISDGQRLVALIRERLDLETRLDRARRAWYFSYGRPLERARAEKAGLLLVPGLERDLARNELGSLELGLWQHQPTESRWGKVALERLREVAARGIT